MVKAAAVTVKAAAMLKMAMTAESAEMAAVMTTAEKVAVDVTDGKDGSRRHIGENAGS
jgi:hypothetical protein